MHSSCRSISQGRRANLQGVVPNVVDEDNLSVQPPTITHESRISPPQSSSRKTNRDKPDKRQPARTFTRPPPSRGPGTSSGTSTATLCTTTPTHPSRSTCSTRRCAGGEIKHQGSGGRGGRIHGHPPRRNKVGITSPVFYVWSNIQGRGASVGFFCSPLFVRVLTMYDLEWHTPLTLTHDRCACMTQIHDRREPGGAPGLEIPLPLRRGALGDNR